MSSPLNIFIAAAISGIAAFLCSQSAMAQSTTECTQAGATINCRTQAAPTGPDFRILTMPNFAATVQQAMERAEAARRDAARDTEQITQRPPLEARVRLPLRKSTPREIYIACGLMLSATDVPPSQDGRISPISAKLCEILTAYYRQPHSSDPVPMRSCVPSSITEGEIAETYMAFWDAYNDVAKQADGPTAFSVALVRKWPCG